MNKYASTYIEEFYKRALSSSEELPWRDRVEVFATNKDGKILGGYYTQDKNHGVFGGGIDGEAPEVAAAREFTEESGYPIENVRLLPVPYSTKEWAPPYTSKTQEERAKQFRGSRTIYATGDIPEGATPNTAVDPSGLEKIKFRSLASALRETKPNRAYSRESALARREAIKLLIKESMGETKNAVYWQKDLTKDILGGRPYPMSYLTGELSEIGEAIGNRDLPNLKEEVQDSLYAGQMILGQRTGINNPVLGADAVIKKFYDRINTWKQMFASHDIPFSVDYLQGGSNYAKPSKIRAAFAIAGVDLSDKDIEEFGHKYKIKFEQPVGAK